MTPLFGSVFTSKATYWIGHFSVVVWHLGVQVARQYSPIHFTEKPKFTLTNYTEFPYIK